jgi:hypothetical protein
MSRNWLSDHDLGEAIKKGVIRNIVALDESVEGITTVRLIYSMWDISFDKMEKLYIPTDVYPDFDFYKRQYGVEIIRDRRLNIEGSQQLAEEYEVACLNNFGKTCLVVGVWSEGGEDECILGMV